MEMQFLNKQNQNINVVDIASHFGLRIVYNPI